MSTDSLGSRSTGPVKWPSQPKRRNIPIYGGSLVVCRNRKDYKAVLAALGDDTGAVSRETIAETDKHVDAKGSVVYLVGVFEGGTQALIHELAHVAFMVLQHVGVPIGRGNNEAYCYLLDALYALATHADATE